jgi:membrane-associated phospholipid phosphatase
MARIKSIDLLFLSYLIITTILIVLGWEKAVNPVQLLGVRMLGFLLAASLIIWLPNHNNPIINLIRYGYPLILSSYFYAETVFFNKFIFSDLDPILVHIDQVFFGQQPSLVFSQSLDFLWFSELMYFSYFCFYLLIASFAIVAFIKFKENGFRLIFQLTASLYLFYLIFSIFPSAGPQFYFLPPENELPQAYFFDRVMHLVQRFGEEPTGAFPSSHVGISVILLWLGRKNLPLWFALAMPTVILLIASTVFIKAHYLIDVVGGIIIAPVILYVATLLYNIFGSHLQNAESQNIQQ